MLTLYQTQTQQLLANPAAPTILYSLSDITAYINTARTQLAGESGCVRALTTLSVTSASQVYQFASITSLPASVQGVYQVRQMNLVSGSGQVYMGSRSFPWAELYWLNNPSPTPAVPTEWAQYGNATTGSLILNTLPDQTYVLIPDVTCYPVLLTTDTTPEAIPYPYTDCVSYLAAYYALMSSQRSQDADKMYGRYQEFLTRARKISIPNVLSMQYDQAITTPLPQPVQQSLAGGGGG